MSRFEVDLTGRFEREETVRPPRRVLKIVLISVTAILAITAVAGWLYWRSFRGTPQYSLALIVDAAKRNDQDELNSLVDVDAIADDFTPQVIGKAVEMYGRGLPPQIVDQLRLIADPVMPAVKDKARAALPKLIRDRVERFGNVPFPLMVLGADRYLDIERNGDLATVRSKLADRPLEIKMKRSGEKWKIVGVRDETLATDISRKIGQEIIAVAVGAARGRNTLGIGGLSDLLRQAQDILQ